MALSKEVYQNYVNILKEELVPALGCTEPIALAYAAAKARQVLGAEPEKIVAECSGNIVKNVKGVIVPNSGNLIGINAAAIVGALGGDADMALEVLHDVPPEAIKRTKKLVNTDYCEVKLLHTTHTLHIKMHCFKGKDSSMVEIRDLHNNIVCIEKNGKVVQIQQSESDARGKYYGVMTDRSVLNFGDILEFAQQVNIDDVRELISRQIKYNSAISKEGMTGNYGVAIGPTILACNCDSIFTKMKARTAAGSEARMGGCILPVITNSGSGNQGITSSIPLVVFAEEEGIDDDTLYRSLVLSNLMTIYQKAQIGRMSAFCAAVSSATSVAAALTFMRGGTDCQVSMAVQNSLANAAGIICDGAKVSCAAKIATSLDSGFLAHQLAMQTKQYEADTGIIKKSLDDTIKSVGRMAAEGMRTTDIEILDIMLEEDTGKSFCED